MMYGAIGVPHLQPSDGKWRGFAKTWALAGMFFPNRGLLVSFGMSRLRPVLGIFPYGFYVGTAGGIFVLGFPHKDLLP